MSDVTEDDISQEVSVSEHMTVGELKAILADLPDDALVWHSIDPEGNRFEPITGYDNDARFRPDDRGDGPLSEPEDWEDEGYESEEEWVAYRDQFKPGLLLWP